MIVLAFELSRAPRSSSHVTNITIKKAGKLMSTGTPASRGAVSSRPCTAGSLLSSAVRYPVESQDGRWTPTPASSVLT